MFRLIILLLLAPLTTVAKESVWFNSGMNNRDITFSPDGDIMLTTVMAPKNLHSMIAMSIRKDGAWTALEVAPFSGEHPDIEPAFSPDGQFVYFASKRPAAGSEAISWDIWRISYDDTGSWGEPENLGAPINSPGNEFYPSLTRNGTLYFTATREDSLGKEDLYRAEPDKDGQYRSLENVGAPVNTEAYEFNAFIDPDENYLIFGSQGRGGNEMGGGDLYISFMEDGEFLEPVLLPAPINTTKLDYCPAVFKGRLYFTSEMPRSSIPKDMRDMSDWYQSPENGLGDIFSIEMEQLLSQLSAL